MKYSKEELTSLMQEYEATHHVDEYVVNGWHVWPLLRLTLCMRWLPVKAHTTETSRNNIVSKSYKFISKIAGRTYSWLVSRKYSYDLNRSINRQNKYDPERNDQHDVKREVVILTLSDRRVILNGALYEIFSDPFVETLKDMGVSTLVWEQGEPRHPRHSSSAWISRRLEVECRRIGPYTLGEAPEWYADYQRLSRQILGRAVEWHEIKGHIDALTRQSLVFEQWFLKVSPRLLIAVCWYAPLVMAAIMAARRLGIKTIEFQHGLQDKVHYAYSRWESSPLNGYEVVPDFFWCWGANSAENLRQYNPAFTAHTEFLAGGNLWLNRWFIMNPSSSRKTVQAGGISVTRTILVTLQLEIEEILVKAIKESPVSWKWLIRFHPARDRVIREQEEQKFRDLHHPGVELEHNNMLLYDLLKESDVHITGYSTCTLEAIALGVPTVLISKNGRATFKQLIEENVVFYAESSDDLLECIRRVTLGADAKTVSQQEFASNEDARKILSYLLECERQKP